jgi:hypothetical protein
MRYVVLHHEGIAQPHFDLMVEWSAGEKLETFRCPAWPPRVGQTLTRIGAHRREYLNYEGPVSGGRGSVRRIAAGDCELAIAPSFAPLQWYRFADFELSIRNSMGPNRKASDLWEVMEIKPI